MIVRNSSRALLLNLRNLCTKSKTHFDNRVEGIVNPKVIMHMRNLFVNAEGYKIRKHKPAH